MFQSKVALVGCTMAVLVFVWLSATLCLASGAAHAGREAAAFPLDLRSYGDDDLGLLAQLQHRIEANPFNLVATIIFLLAILHTFAASKLTAISHRFEHDHEKKVQEAKAPLHSVSHSARLLHFLGEVEVVFGLWAIPLLITVVLFHDWTTAVGYVAHSVDYTEAMFVVVIMVLASTRPILKLSETAMSGVARLFGGSLTAWWLTILTVGPLLSSFITEPAAMTICALLLVRKFYELEPSPRLKYATLGLLFVNISVGGTLTHFAAPPVLMVAGPWGWGMGHMLLSFGWKAALGIFAGNTFYWLILRNDFVALRERFEARALKEKVLTTGLPREALERAIDSISAEVREESGDFRETISGITEELVEKVREPLETECVERLVCDGIDRELAVSAFRQRFEEIKLYRFQREVPHLLPPEQRAPFMDPNWDQREDRVPAWVVLVHVIFMGWTIANAHHPQLFIPGLLFFLGFAAVTADYQNKVTLTSPLLVGFFLGGLVTHGGCQGWWIEPVLGGLSEFPLMLTSTILTSFNDNAAITYLSTLVPGFTDSLKYAVVAGAVAGGGLTVIANAPNPAGQSILNRHFEGGITPLGLLKAALIPTVILFVLFFLLR